MPARDLQTVWSWQVLGTTAEHLMETKPQNVGIS